ncbi:hypothetical protein BGZ73_006870 [Actinomortierella ambigua]|nr:hypothetical protein BGZ73_006870 [Actinomortierella ambigua]
MEAGSITNTVLQYCLLAAILYLYVKMPMLGNNHGKKQLSMFSTFGQLNFSRTFGGTEKPRKLKSTTPDTLPKEQPEDQELLLHPPTPPSSSSSPSSKRKSLKRSGSSRTSIHEQQGKPSTSSSANTSPTSTRNTLVLGRRLVTRPSEEGEGGKKSSFPAGHGDPSSEAPRSPLQEKHRRFLKEAFSNVPMTEIDHKIKAANWDMSEAAAMLAQEDYTWQSVPRRRSIHK